MTSSPHPWDEIAELDSLLESFGADASEYFGVELMRGGLEHRRALLVDDLIGVEEHSSASLDVILRAATGARRGADLSVVAGLLGELQATVAAIGQAIVSGPTRRGVIPHDIQELTRLKLSVALPGSLALRLVPGDIAQTLAQLQLLDEEPSVLEESVDRLLSIVDEPASAEGVLEQIAELGTRTAAHVRELARILSDSGTNAHLIWRTEERLRDASVTAEFARGLHTFLEAAEDTERTFTVSGRLVGGSLVRGRFELELADETILSGPAIHDVVAQIEALFGASCTATVSERTTYFRTAGETRQTYTLVGLEPLT